MFMKHLVNEAECNRVYHLDTLESTVYCFNFEEVLTRAAGLALRFGKRDVKSANVINNFIAIKT